MIRCFLPGRLLGKHPNGREHWAAKAKRVQGERARVHGALLVDCGPDYSAVIRTLIPARVTFCRVGVRLVDSDNLQGICAAVRDELAAIMGITDGPTDTRAEWVYCQRKGRPGVEVTIEARAVESAA